MVPSVILKTKDVARDAAKDVGYVPGREELRGTGDPDLVALDLEGPDLEPRHKGLYCGGLRPGADAALGGDALL